MLQDDDADIDALMGSIVGHNGQVAEFPPKPADVVPIRPAAKRAKLGKGILAAVDALSGELAVTIAANEAERSIVDPRTIPVRFSRLKHMSASAAHYWQACQDDNDDTIAMRFGRGFHALCLGTPVHRWTGKNRSSNDYKAFIKENPGVEVLTAKEWDTAHRMFESIQRHATARELLFGAGSVLEETIEWQFQGRQCTSRPDARRGTELLVDLKSTVCSEPGKFNRDAMFRGYHSQFSFYGHAMHKALGAFPAQSFCVAVEKKKPHVVTVLELPKETIEEGAKAWRLWWEQLMACEAANVWPGYTEAIVQLEVFDTGDASLIIDGEEHSWDE
jgi:hypothetical protein